MGKAGSVSDSEMRTGIILMVLASVVQGLGVVVRKAGLSTGIEPSSFTFATFFIATLFLVPYYLHGEREELSLKDYRNFFILGLIGSGGAQLLIYFGQSLTSAVNAGFVGKMTVPFTAILAFFILKERLRKIDWFAIIIGLLGVYLLSTQGRMLFVMGDLLIVGGAFFLAIENIFVKKLTNCHSTRVILFWRILLGTLVLMLASTLISGNPVSGFGYYTFLNGFLTALTFICLYKSFDLVGPSISITIFLLSSIFAAVFAVLLISEPVQPTQIIGGAAIILGAFIVSRR